MLLKCNGYCVLYFKTNTGEDVDESVSDRIEKRNTMLENMLVLLNSAAALGVGPGPGEFRRSRSPGLARETSVISPFPGSGKGIRRG